MSFFSALARSLEAVPLHMTITGTERIGSHIQKVTLSFTPAPGLHFDIGSYIQPMIAGTIPRAYSIAEASENTCTIIVSFSGMGVGARFFAGAPAGTVIDAYGPYSDFPYHAGTGRPKIFLATGTGVAPFVRMVPEAIREGLFSLLVLGVPQEHDIPYRDRFDGLQGELFFPMYVLSRPGSSWDGARGYVPDQFTGERLQWLRSSDVYVCGVPRMIESTLAMLSRAGVPKKQIFVQAFG